MACWRGAYEPFWRRPYWYHPGTRTATFDLFEMLAAGGLEDLLRSFEWKIWLVDARVDPNIYNDPRWVLELFNDADCSGDPMGFGRSCLSFSEIVEEGSYSS